MIIKTNEFKDACKAINVAMDNISVLELVVKDSNLFLNVTNNEYYVGVKYQLENPEEFRAVVNAKLFLDLVTNISTETMEMTIVDRNLQIKAGKSKYTVPMIYENDELTCFPRIKLGNASVEMNIKQEIFSSIYNANRKEYQKIKSLDANILQQFYYITECGAFNFTTGACLNMFTLDKPIKLLLNDRIVKLFKLFNSDVDFRFGHDFSTNGIETKVIFETGNVYVAAIITNDEKLLTGIQGPYEATKSFMGENYPVKAVVSVNSLNEAITRLFLFAKNGVSGDEPVATVNITDREVVLSDNRGNSETIMVENGSFVGDTYTFGVKMNDIKLVLDSCRDEHITINCGNSRSIVINRGSICNLIPEGRV